MVPNTKFSTPPIAKYQKGEITYILTDTTILSDSSQAIQPTQQFSITIQFPLVIDIEDSTVSAKTKDPTRPLNAKRSNQLLIIDTTGLGTCPQTNSSQPLAKLAEILPVALGTTLTPGSTWTDSTTITFCREAIPIILAIKSTYIIHRQVTKNGTNTIHITKTDTMNASGAGSSGFHHTVVTASGSGKTDIYFDFTRGHTLEATTSQKLQWSITASNQTRVLIQESRQRLELSSDTEN
jgi:hypothetical protein